MRVPFASGAAGTRRLRTISAALALTTTSLSSQSTGAVPTWRATEQWRVDGTEAGASGFADLRDLVVLKDGSLWTLDFKEQSIRRYDARGRFVGTTGRAGAGPGEMRNANGMLVHGDGTVWINDPSNGRFTVVSADGRFANQHTLPINGYGYRWDAWFDRTTQDVIDPTLLRTGDDYARVWRRVGATGTTRGTVEVPACAALAEASPATFTGWRAEGPGRGSAMGAYPFTSGGGVAATGRGAVWCASPDAAQASLVRIGSNDTIARSTLRLPRLPVTPAERTEAIAQIRTRLERYATNDFDASKVPNTKPAIGALWVDDDGRLWIMHTQTHEARRTVYDVHDDTGAHLGRVSVPFRVSPAMPPRARGMQLWLPVLDEDDVAAVVHFTLTR
jgi:hypothetical protein